MGPVLRHQKTVFTIKQVSKQTADEVLNNNLDFLEVLLPLDIVKAGDHCDLNISKHILPLLLMFG